MQKSNTTGLIHIVGGEKGGVGKSLLARLLCDYYARHDTAMTAFDCDASNPSLTRFYRPITQAININAQHSLDGIVETVYEQRHNAIVDLPAQSLRQMEEWWQQSDVINFCKAHRIAICYWLVCDDSFDAMQLTSEFLGKHHQDFPTVVVKNLGRGNDFSAFDHLPMNTAAKHTLFLPRIDSSLMHPIDQHNLSFDLALSEASPISEPSKRRLKQSLDDIYCLFDSVIAPSAKRLLALNLRELLAIKTMIDELDAY